MRFITVILICCGCVLFFAEQSSAHSIHISYAHAEQRGDALHIKVTYFKDDFFAAMHAWNPAAPISNAEWTSRKNEFVMSVWTVRANNVPIPPADLRCVEDGSSVSFEFDAPHIQSHTPLAVTHSALFALFSDENNLLTVNTASTQDNFVLTKGKQQCAFIF